MAKIRLRCVLKKEAIVIRIGNDDWGMGGRKDGWVLDGGGAE